jgi:hypothetical protein
LKAYRETIINNILNSISDFEVKFIIDKAFQRLKSNGTHPFIILRFTVRMTADLMDTKFRSLSLQEKNNASQALNVLSSYEVKNATKEKIERH